MEFFSLTNTQRLDIRGRVKVLHGQNRKTEEPPLALFAICTPFGPPSLLELPHKESMFKSKHRLDLALVSMDQRYEKKLVQILFCPVGDSRHAMGSLRPIKDLSAMFIGFDVFKTIETIPEM